MKLLPLLNGYKTYVAGAGFILLGVYDLVEGRTREGLEKIATGLGLIGLGHKLTKNGQPVNP